MGKKRKRGYNRHHVLPRSKGGDASKENITIQKIVDHRAYHKEFSNLTPDEIIKYLVEEWWNGQWHWVQKALSDRRLK